MTIRMQQRRGTSEQWTTVNPVLAEGEIGIESDTNKFKIGDGINAWSDLVAFIDETNLTGSLNDYIPLTDIGVANGVASLDANGQVPTTQLQNLPDFEMSSPVSGQAIVYNGTKWSNSEVSTDPMPQIFMMMGA